MCDVCCRKQNVQNNDFTICRKKKIIIFCYILHINKLTTDKCTKHINLSCSRTVHYLWPIFIDHRHTQHTTHTQTFFQALFFPNDFHTMFILCGWLCYFSVCCLSSKRQCNAANVINISQCASCEQSRKSDRRQK